MYIAKSILGVVLTALVWCSYARLMMWLEENHEDAWITKISPASFPLIVCAIVGLNIVIGTDLSGMLFVGFIGLGMIWALGAIRFR